MKNFKEIYKRLLHPDHAIVSLVALSIIGILVVCTFNFSFLNPVGRAIKSFTMSSIYYRIMNMSDERETSDLITLVDMTELHHRDSIAHVVEQITEMEPRRLGVDIIFEGHKDDIMGDEALTEAFFGCADKAVVAFKLLDYNGKEFTNAVHSFFTSDVPVTEGFTNAMTDDARSIRRYHVSYPYHGKKVLSLPAQITKAEGLDIENLRTDHIINYKPVNFPVVGWQELSQHPELIRNRIVLLGTTKEESDKHYTPTGKMSGLEVIAYATLSMIEGYSVSEAGFFWCILLAFIVGCLTNMIDTTFKSYARHRKSALMIFITASGFYVKLIYFSIMVILTWTSFLLYVKANYYIDTLLALSVIVFTGEARLIYKGILALLKKFNFNIWRKSIYANEI
ncbi:MAG: CHASE2 domain-containing protein [Prevotella sp.]|nr:CHASE2 domain-containing protein [Prevotella sp.]